MTAIELGNYDDVAPAEDVAKAFGRDPKQFKRVVNQLVRKGCLTVSGDMLVTVYPTVATLRQKPDLSESDAQGILKMLVAPRHGSLDDLRVAVPSEGNLKSLCRR